MLYIYEDKLRQAFIIKILYRMNLIWPMIGVIMTLVTMDSMRGFLICSGKEEALRFSLENLLEDQSYIDGMLSKLPLYHPYQILIFVICKLRIFYFSRIWSSFFCIFRLICNLKAYQISLQKLS